MSIVYHRLDRGLGSWQVNAAKRRTHILTKMLYQVELNPQSVRTLRARFGTAANIAQGDFMQEGWVKKLGVGKFDVVLGNPPYQRGMVEKKGTNAGRRTLWDQFVIRGLGVLVDAGVLGMITPGGWRGTGRHSAVGSVIRSKELLYLHVFDAKAGYRHFGVGTRFDVYVVRNRPSKTAGGKTLVVDESGGQHKLNLAQWPFIPGGMFAEFDKLVNAGSHTGKRSAIYGASQHPQNTRQLSAKKSGEYRHPVVHSINRDGVGYWYSTNGKVGGFGVPKVVLNMNGKQYSYPAQNDHAGKLGMTILSFGIPIKSKADGEKVLRAVATPLFQDLIAASKWGAFQTDYRMFSHFRDDWPEWVLANTGKGEGKSKQKRTTRSGKKRVRKLGRRTRRSRK